MQIFRRNGRGEREAGHLAEGMNASVGASGALRQRRFAGDPPERGLQLTLDGGLAGLHLPAAEIRAVVGQGQLPVLLDGGGLSLVVHFDGHFEVFTVLRFPAGCRVSNPCTFFGRRGGKLMLFD